VGEVIQTIVASGYTVHEIAFDPAPHRRAFPSAQ